MPHTAESGRPGALARLSREDWNAMTAAANRGREEKWRRVARESNPNLSDEQVDRLAEHLQREHCRRMGRLSAEARRIKRELAEEEARGGPIYDATGLADAGSDGVDAA